MKLMERFPIIITLGAGLLGYVAGEMAVGDPAVKGVVENLHYLHIVVPIVGALLVVGVGKVLASRQAAAVPAEA